MPDSSPPPSADVSGRVEAVIREVLGLESDPLLPTSRLKEDLGADSVDAVMLVMALEREFKGKISDEDVVKLSTVGEIVDFLNQRIGGQGMS